MDVTKGDNRPMSLSSRVSFFQKGGGDVTNQSSRVVVMCIVTTPG
jgi:hypothetical protein